MQMLFKNSVPDSHKTRSLHYNVQPVNDGNIAAVYLAHVNAHCTQKAADFLMLQHLVHLSNTTLQVYCYVLCTDTRTIG